MSKHIGSDFDDFLAEQGMDGEVTDAALKRVMAAPQTDWVTLGMSQQAVFASARKLGTRVVTVTQSMSDMPNLERRVAYLRKTAAFKEWQEKLKVGDRLPRGKFFKGKKAGRPLRLLDEFGAYI